MPRLAFVAAALLALVAFTACDQYGELTSPVGQARIRLINVSPDSPPLALVRNDSVLQQGVSYPGVSAYSAIPATRTSQLVITDGEGGALLALSVVPANQADYAAVVFGHGAQRAVAALRSETSIPAGGTARIRIVHTSANIGVVDMYITEPNAAIEDVEPTQAARDFGNVSGYIERIAATYRVRATTVGTKDVLLDEPVVLGSGGNYTAFIVEADGGGEPYSLLLVEDSGT